MIALTYDDGPNEPYTRQVLDLLAEYGVKATFFVIGKWAKQLPAGVKAIAAGGHEIGCHTETHPQLSSLDMDRRWDEVFEGDETIQEVTAVKPILFRAPFGDAPEGIKDIHIGWDIHGGDWAAKSVVEITHPIFEYLDAHKSGIVLLHDGYYKEFGADRSLTVEATRRILERYKSQKFVTISEYAVENSLA